jgi:hypothetical protein
MNRPIMLSLALSLLLVSAPASFGIGTASAGSTPSTENAEMRTVPRLSAGSPPPSPAGDGRNEKSWSRADTQQTWARANDIIGMSSDTAGQVTAALSRTAPEAALEQARASVARSSEGRPVTVRRSTLTKADLDSTRTRLVAFQAKHPKSSFSFHFDAAKDATVVSGDVPDSLTEELRETGKVILDLSPENTVSRDVGHISKLSADARKALQCRKSADCGPWHFGSAFIASPNGAVCTSGFSMQDTIGGTYSMTAGHCGGLGSHWGTSASAYGVVVARPPYPQYDMAKLRCCDEYGKQIWTSQYSTRDVSWAWDQGVGYPNPSGICVSGGVTVNEFCFARVTSTNATICTNDGCTTGVMRYERDDGHRMAQSGDSGAAVYVINPSGTVDVTGIHIGTGTYSGGRVVHYAEKYSAIQYQFHGQIRNW